MWENVPPMWYIVSNTNYLVCSIQFATVKHRWRWVGIEQNNYTFLCGIATFPWSVSHQVKLRCLYKGSTDIYQIEVSVAFADDQFSSIFTVCQASMRSVFLYNSQLLTLRWEHMWILSVFWDCHVHTIVSKRLENFVSIWKVRCRVFGHTASSNRIGLGSECWCM